MTPKRVTSTMKRQRQQKQVQVMRKCKAQHRSVEEKKSFGEDFQTDIIQSDGDGDDDDEGKRDASQDSTSEFQKRVLHNLVEIKGLLKQVLERAGNTGNASNPEVLQIVENPLATPDEFVVLEEKLLDVQLRTHLVNYFKRIGGHDMKDMVRNVMNRMMAKQLQTCFCFKGANKQKMAFGRTALCAVVEESVLASHTCTQTEVRDRIQLVLKYAYQRKD